MQQAVYVEPLQSGVEVPGRAHLYVLQRTNDSAHVLDNLCGLAEEILRHSDDPSTRGVSASFVRNFSKEASGENPSSFYNARSHWLEELEELGVTYHESSFQTDRIFENDTLLPLASNTALETAELLLTNLRLAAKKLG